MVSAPVTENKTANIDVYDINVELVQFTTAASGDYYLVKKLKNVDAAFATQATENDKEIHRLVRKERVRTLHQRCVHG